MFHNQVVGFRILDDIQTEALKTFEDLLSPILTGCNTKKFIDVDPVKIANCVWSVVHGFSMLYLDHQLFLKPSVRLTKTETNELISVLENLLCSGILNR